MPKPIEVDLDGIYSAWRLYLLKRGDAKFFGMVFDTTKKAQFPYANLRMISRPTMASDLQGDESSISITFETEAYINTDKYLMLYRIDEASANFFLELGFRRVSDTQLIKVSDTVTKVVSRFTMTNYCGCFLKEIESF